MYYVLQRILCKREAHLRPDVLDVIFTEVRLVAEKGAEVEAPSLSV